MNLLITGANGFIGRNLRAALQQSDHRLLLIDVSSSAAEFARAANDADFVFHLAGVNRPDNDAEFRTGNADLTEKLVEALEKGKRPPVLISSSTQAALQNPYGVSKAMAEQALRRYGSRAKSPVYVYRLTNVFGKWSRPNYNSAVATFCYNTARGLPITVNDPDAVLRLVYIDDVITEFLRALNGKPTRGDDGFYTAGPEQEITLKKLISLLRSFSRARSTLDLPDQRSAFAKKLFATYQSFLPPDRLAYTPKAHADERGSFAELLHMNAYGQMSVNVTKPHVTKGFHWHHTKHEKFIVVSGRGVIRLQDPFGGEVYTYEVSGKNITVVDIPPGYVHTIENTGGSDLVTLMWANEVFDPAHADTFHREFQEIPTGDEAK
ncbi:MAG: NAD-dependent epimerase/dehydratase family protein [Clostridiales bacterium]|nr:NAD-dependent epimerase/dehydratase family protein [Clostridiales bacterium]